jgi:uncharacterized cofD-like protein
MSHARTKDRPGRLSVWLKKYTVWLTPGLGVKRWFLLILLGITLLGLGLGILLLDIYREAPATWWLPLLSQLSLRFLPRLVRVLVFGGIGVGLVAIGLWELNRSLVAPLIRPGRGLADTLRQHRQRERGPRIVAIGGGHGLATLLRSLKNQTNNITAIVTVADDGGSSGRLRRDMGILPPGDIRNCLAALSEDEALMAQLFQYRFPAGEAGLEGHSFGNLFITALAEITGSFEAAVAESGRVLAVKGRVLPSTLNDVRLSADVRMPHAISEVRIQGESQIPKSNGRVRHVWLEPSNPPAFPQAIQAILAADLIVIGPGSLFTSILPNLLVPDLTEAVRASRALKLFICNVATERGETTGYTAGDHIRTVEDHISSGLFDIAVSNSNYADKLPKGVDWVRVEAGLSEEYRIYQADLVDALYPWRHDSAKLSRAVMDLYQQRAGPLVESASNSK